MKDLKDPLTDEEKKKFLDNFTELFHQKYETALKSGALSDEDYEEHDHTLARCILVITAHKFEPLAKQGRMMLTNLELWL